MRALLIAIESLGVGQLTDHPTPNTLAQLFGEVPGLELPTFFALGLGEILKGRVFDPPARKCIASYGRMIQRSAGADLLSGLWELAGVVSSRPVTPAAWLPGDFQSTLARECGTAFLFTSCEALSLPPELAQEHRKTGTPILSTGPGSMLRVWAGESTFPTHQLARLCRKVRHCADAWRIARVEGRHLSSPETAAVSLPMVPPRTLLNAIADRGLTVEAVGVIRDFFARSGITRTYPAATQAESFQTVDHLWQTHHSGLVFAHLAPLAAATAPEQAAALREIDAWISGFLEKLDNDNLLIVTGTNRPGMWDPASPREEVPVLLHYGGRTQPLGVRETFADVAATLAAFFGIKEPGSPWANGAPLITFQRPRGFSGPWGS